MRNFLIFVLAIGLSAGIFVRVRYGGGEPYPDLSTPPLLQGVLLEEVLQYPEPIGNVAVSHDGRVFFTVHPESRPQGNKLLEWVAGAAVPYPSGTVQPHLFDAVLGLCIDRQQRLWTIDHGKQGFATPRLLAFDLRTGDLVHDHEFRGEIAPAGSFLQDLQVTPDGLHVIVTDGSIWRKKPALIVYDIAGRKARRILESHESVMAENYLIQNSIKDLSFLGGLFTLKSGVAGIAIDKQNEWLYYAATNHGGLYRIGMQYVTDATLPESELADQIERFSDKPLSDGLASDMAGNIYITDVEHNAVSIVGSNRQPRTLIQSPDIRWASAVSFGPDGFLYVADSAFPELVLETKRHIAAAGPFSIYRFAAGDLVVPSP